MKGKEQEKGKGQEKARKTASGDPQKPFRPGQRTAEAGGPQGLEPTRYGDWERKGRCVDF